MFGRRVAILVVALFLCAVLAPAVFAAAPKPAKPAAPQSDPYDPTNVKRAVMALDSLSGMLVKFRTAQGATVTLSAVNPQMILLKNLRVAKPSEFKPGDKVVVYYNVPSSPKDFKLLWAVMDPASEVVLSELRAKPTEATFKSFDPETRKLTVQTRAGAKTYTMVAPPMAVREMKGAALGKPNTQKEKGYAVGDNLLLVMTANRKQVRLVIDKWSYDRLDQGLKKFPVPPMPKSK
jgi:hypothetical protein